MKLLALETSGESCSCALLYADGSSCQRSELAPRRHTRLILGMVEAVLAEAGLGLRQLDTIAVSRGPGSFTGVRIGISVAQGLALGADLPLTPISSLRALAQGGWRRQQARRVLAAFDARLGEIYLGAYQCDERDLMQAVIADCLLRPPLADIAVSGSWNALGSAWGPHRQLLEAVPALAIESCHSTAVPEAVDVACLAREEFARGGALPAAAVLPNYLRMEVARPKPPVAQEPFSRA